MTGGVCSKVCAMKTCRGTGLCCVTSGQRDRASELLAREGGQAWLMDLQGARLRPSPSCGFHFSLLRLLPLPLGVNVRATTLVSRSISRQSLGMWDSALTAWTTHLLPQAQKKVGFVLREPYTVSIP